MKSERERDRDGEGEKEGERYRQRECSHVMPPFIFFFELKSTLNELQETFQIR